MKDAPIRRRDWWIWGVVAGGTLVGVVIAGLGVYLARGPIAASLARHWLSDHGVASAIEIQGLSLTGFQGKLRLGDPADPDLTVERLDVGYVLTGPWDGRALGLRPRNVRLVRPRLKLRLADGKLDFGALDRLVRELEQRPPTAETAPDVTVEDGQVLLSALGGTLRSRGSGAMRAGRLITLEGRVDPFHLTLGRARLDSAGGAVHAVGIGSRLVATVDFGPTSVLTRVGASSAAKAALTINIPYPSDQERWGGPARLKLSAGGVAASIGAGRVEGGNASLDVEGAVEANARSQRFVGVARASGGVALIKALGSTTRDATARMDFTRFAFSHDAHLLSVSGDGRAALSAAHVDAAGRELSALDGALRVHGLDVRFRGGAPRVVGVLDGRLAGDGALGAPAARRLAQTAPLISGEAAYASATERALRAFHFEAPAWRVALDAAGGDFSLGIPLRVKASSGANLTLGGRMSVSARGTPTMEGVADFALGGGGMPSLGVQMSRWSVSPAGFQADMAAQGAFDALAARGARVEVKGRATMADRIARFDLAECAPVTARSLAFEPNAVGDFAARICPGGGSLIEAGPAGWRARGRLEAVAGAMPGLAVDLRRAEGTFEVAGASGDPDTAALVFDQAGLTDTTDPVRFRPLAGAGRFDLAGGVWRGHIAVASQAGHPIGEVVVQHDIATGVGRADIDAGALRFAPGALQPADLTPMAAFVREADGLAAFKGWFAWRSSGALASGGGLEARALSFKSPLGPLTNLDADVRFVSLLPLVTAPDQTITVGKVEAIVPLTDLSAAFDFDADRINLHAARAAVAKGHVSLTPMTVPFANDGALEGALLLDRVDLGDLIATFNLADAIKTDAVIDGRIPFEFEASRLKITAGHLTAVAPGRISISRQALGGVSNTASAPVASSLSGQANFAQDLAYQALDNLAFDQLDASVNSVAGDRLGMLFHIKGRHDPPRRQKATIALTDLIAGRALAKPIALPSDTKIDLTLDSSLNFGELVEALGVAWRNALGGGEAHRSGPVQGQTSRVTTP